MIPPEWKDKIMHASMKIGDTWLMASDGTPDFKEDFGGFSVAIKVKTPEEAERIFKALSEGGTVRMPMAETFWAHRFGMLDRQVRRALDGRQLEADVISRRPPTLAAGGPPLAATEPSMSYMLLVLQTPFINSTLTPEEGRHRYDDHEGLRRGPRRARHPDRRRGARLREARAPGSARGRAARASSTGHSSRQRRSSAASSCSMCRPREQAIEIAKACPAVDWATVEVREVGPCWDEFRS